jgi:hypothetical protein
MSLTKTSFSMINGSVGNVVDYGADPTGSSDSTTAINAAITANSVVVIPPGTYRCDSTIQIYDDYKTVLLQGTLKRFSANSASTRPVVRIKGNYCSFQGVGPASTVWSENAAPLGVFLWGSENPGDVTGSDSVNSRHVNVSKFRIRAKDGASSGLTLALLSSEFYSSGALYDGIFSDLLLVGGEKQLYLNPVVNGNTFSNINFYETRGYSVYLDGLFGGLITDNQFSNFFIDAAVLNTVSYYGRYVVQCVFSNMGGEPGGGTYVNFDANSASIVWTGYDNHPSNGSWLATDSFYSANGETRLTNLTNKKITMTTATSASVDAGVYVLNSSSQELFIVRNNGNVQMPNLATSAAGLPSGSLWVDTTASNVLKRVP